MKKGHRRGSGTEQDGVKESGSAREALQTPAQVRALNRGSGKWS